MVAPRHAVSAGRVFAERTTTVSPSIPTGARMSSPLFSSQISAISTADQRTLTASQIEAIRTAMKLFVEDDLSRGIAASGRIYCDGCERARPSAGVINYDRYVLCNNCAIEYEVARARGAITTPGQYVRDKHFGDGDLYLLAD